MNVWFRGYSSCCYGAEEMARTHDSYSRGLRVDSGEEDVVVRCKPAELKRSEK